MKLRYYAEAGTDVDHRRTLELLESITEQHAICVEVVQVESQLAPPADFAGMAEQRSLDNAWNDFTYNRTLQEGLGGAPSDLYPNPEDIVGNVGIVVDDDLVWATRFWGTHHGWGPVDKEATAIGFLEEVESRGTAAVADRVPLDGWAPTDDNPDSTVETSISSDVQKPTRDAIRNICTAQSFQRGVGYFEHGRVRELTIAGNEVTATVRGTHDYRISVDLSATNFDSWCSCPYDYAGDCKHIVAVLLTVADRYNELAEHSSTDGQVTGEQPGTIGDTAADQLESVDDIEWVVDEADDESVRAFLRDVLITNADLRERFLATIDAPVEKSVADYKRDLNRRFENATGRRSIIEYDTHLEFSENYDLADAYRESDNYDRALDIYRALAETIYENLERIDDSSGHYGRQIERAIDTYAECLLEADLNHDERREHIDYLFERYQVVEFEFVRGYYDEALREICVTTDDLEYLLALLRPHIPTVEDDTAMATPTGSDQMSERESGHTEIDSDDEVDTADTDSDSDTDTQIPDPTGDRLNAELFTGRILAIDRLNVGPLDVTDFIGETFARELADAGVTDDGHEEAGRDEGDSPERLRRDRRGGRFDPRNAHTGYERTVLSTYLSLLSELDEQDALRATLESVYTETTEFYRQYVKVLVADGQDDRAKAVIEDGLEEFSHSADVHWLAAEFYHNRDADRYRDVLQTLFVRFGDWDAYDELADACSDEMWESVFHAIVTQLGRIDRDRLIDLYIYEDEREKALSKVLDSEDVSTLRRYRANVANRDPETYFETYRELLEPYLAAETGRDHYRTVIAHLQEMEKLGYDEQLDEFIAHLKEKHSNRPALRDELDRAGF